MKESMKKQEEMIAKQQRLIETLMKQCSNPNNKEVSQNYLS